MLFQIRYTDEFLVGNDDEWTLFGKNDSKKNMLYKEIVSGRHEMFVKFSSSPERKSGGISRWVNALNGIDAIFKCL